MRSLKSHPLFKLLNSYLIDSPQPSNLNYLWNFGSLLALCLGIQIITGVTLAMHYNPSINEAFNSVEHIMRDVNNGWLIRYLHSNTASAFFFLVYLHIGRGMYYGSYKAPRTLVWVVGTIIFILMIVTAFLGYVYSPKWFIFITINVFNLFNNNISIIFNILSLFTTISLVKYYLDGYKLSNVYYIRLLQIVSVFSILFFIIMTTLSYTYESRPLFANDNTNDSVKIHGHINVTKDAAAELSKGISAVGSNIGLSGVIVGVVGAVGNTIAKSGMLPLQKAGIVIGVSLLGGFMHSIISKSNRNEGIVNKIEYDNSPISNISNVNKFLDSSDSTPLEGIVSDIQHISITCLSLIFILCIQLIFKFYMKESITLNLLKDLGNDLFKSLEIYVNKIINLNKKVNVFYIWLIILLLVVGLSTIYYAIYDLDNNLDKYIKVHNYLKKKVIIKVEPISKVIKLNKLNDTNVFYIQKRFYSTKEKTILDKFLEHNDLKPVQLFSNLQLKSTQDNIRISTKNISGVYMIFNNITGDYYIGSASTNNFYNRFYRHVINLSGSKIVKLAVKNYKLKNFTFLILDLFPEVVNKENNKKLLDLEDFYLKSLLPNYNILTEAGNSFGYKHTEISRIKMRINYSKNRKLLIGNLNKNKHLSEDVKDKIRPKDLLSQGVFIEEALLNMKKSSKPIILYNKDGTVYGEYNSIMYASEILNCNIRTISRALSSKSKLLKRRWIVKYKS
jgi:group I intron endonuclease